MNIYTNKWWFQRWQQAFLFWNCYVTLTFCSLLARCRIPCACHAKPHPNFQKLRFVWVVIVCDWMPGKRKENFQEWSFDFQMCFAPQRRALIKSSQLPKALRCSGFLYIFTWKRAPRHSSMRFFDISVPESFPKLRFFVLFNFDMCFAPQWRALFHLSSGQMAPHPPL